MIVAQFLVFSQFLCTLNPMHSQGKIITIVMIISDFTRKYIFFIHSCKKRLCTITEYILEFVASNSAITNGWIK